MQAPACPTQAPAPHHTSTVSFTSCNRLHVRTSSGQTSSVSTQSQVTDSGSTISDRAVPQNGIAKESRKSIKPLSNGIQSLKRFGRRVLKNIRSIFRKTPPTAHIPSTTDANQAEVLTESGPDKVPAGVGEVNHDAFIPFEPAEQAEGRTSIDDAGTPGPTVETTEGGQGLDSPPTSQRRRVPVSNYHEGNRIIVDTNYERSSSFSGVKITCTCTLLPALQFRFTHLRFSLKLPDGQRIIDINPEYIVGQQTNLRYKISVVEEIVRSVSSASGPSGVGLEFIDSHIRSLEFSSTARAELQGQGKDTDTANWAASEDIVGRYGLDNKFTFSVIIQADDPPTSVKCQYTASVQKQNAVELINRSYGHTWDAIL